MSSGSGFTQGLSRTGTGLATAGEVLVSQTVRDLVAGSGLTFEERGMHALKGVPSEWRLFKAIVD